MWWEVCLAPIVAAGLAIATPNIAGDSGMSGGAIVKVQTCQKGLGAFVKVMPTKDTYIVGAQWGLTKEFSGFTFHITPQFGFGHASNVRALPVEVPYMFGVGIGVSYGNVFSEIDLSHMSNGKALGICLGSSSACARPNIGVTPVALMVGYKFDWF